eukprot:6194547-Pleurochrysis_carterae.AAC.1
MASICPRVAWNAQFMRCEVNSDQGTCRHSYNRYVYTRRAASRQSRVTEMAILKVLDFAKTARPQGL